MDKNVVERYGAKATLQMLIEESGELITAISHYERVMYGAGYACNRTDTVEKLNQAVADAMNALQSAIYICKDIDKDEVERLIKKADEKVLDYSPSLGRNETIGE